MRIEFEDGDLRRLYDDASFAAPQYGRDLVRAFRKKVAFLQDAASELDLRAYRALHYEKLAGDRVGEHSIRLNDQWRLILRVDADDLGRILIILAIEDYH